MDRPRSREVPDIERGTHLILGDQGVRRLSAIGLAHEEAIALVRLIDKWVRCMGEEETVARLKAIKVDYVRHLADLPPVAPWVSRHPDGRPRGPFSILWRFSKRDLFKCWNALMSYSAFTFGNKTLKCTNRQYAKFLLAVKREQPSETSLLEAKSIIDASDLRFPPPEPMVARPLLHMYPKPSKTAPVAGGASVSQEEGILDSVVPLAFNMLFVDKHKEQILPVLRGLEKGFQQLAQRLSHLNRKKELRRRGPLVGQVNFLQDRGYKLRHVASPYPVYQRITQPLGDYLMGCLRDLEEDCTFNQEKGVSTAQRYLKEGRRAHSFDLTQCTDHLPLSLQLYLLRKLHVEEKWVSLFEDICRGEWLLQDGHPIMKRVYSSDGGVLIDNIDQQLIKWSVGQPLGLYPSFASFALLHHSLVRGLFRRRNKKPVYVLLGDDIIIFDDDVAQDYVALMSSLGVPISPTKSLVSDHVCEFAGRVILSDQVIQGYKWKGKTDDSFIEVCRNLGPKSMGLFTPRQRAVLSVLAPVPEPYGFGWNPEGLPYTERLGDWELALRSVVERVPTADSRSRNINKLLRHSSCWYFLDINEIKDLASDQEASEIINSLLSGSLSPLGVLMIPNIRDLGVDRSLGHYKEVLRDFGNLEQVAHVSALVRAERTIKKVRNLNVRRARVNPSWIRRWRAASAAV